MTGTAAAEIYTPEQRQRRDASVWTLVQGILAPLQFLIFAVSVLLVGNYLINGTGYDVAVASVMIKTLVLLTIMVTGAIWEKVVFGRYLFAPAFFWEDVVSMLVIALHVGYVASWLFDWMSPREQMLLALAAYFSYVINAAQFLYKFRLARRPSPPATTAMPLSLVKT
ncbi:MAG: 2-vinyl bacteriochlorophyllide hydratase [Halieaceae bacterium]|jgi:3-vinyl bacteriochlorophyllide hydratase|nr:2-vinyl bacteriochlorophyllide hydratase [Halieaceae bacterium]